MKYKIKIEELFMFFLALYFFYYLNYAWWVFWALLLVPDIGMVGYAVNSRVGAFTYNLTHHKALAIFLWLGGLQFSFQAVQLAGLIMFAHSSMDRIFGFGLKYKDDFKHTHLGYIGDKNV